MTKPTSVRCELQSCIACYEGHVHAYTGVHIHTLVVHMYEFTCTCILKYSSFSVFTCFFVKFSKVRQKIDDRCGTESKEEVIENEDEIKDLTQEQVS